MRSIGWLLPGIFALVVSCSRSEPKARSGDLSTDRDANGAAPLSSPDVGAVPNAPSDPLPSVTADALRAKIRELHAKAVVVNAWATWCGSCEHELPMLQGLADSLAPAGVRVVLVSVDEPEARIAARDFLADKGIRLPSYWATRPLGPFKAGLNPRWPGMVPATFLFDGTATLRYFWGGEAFETELVPIVEGLLAGRHIDGEAQFGLAPDQPTPH